MKMWQIFFGALIVMSIGVYLSGVFDSDVVIDDTKSVSKEIVKTSPKKSEKVVNLDENVVSEEEQKVKETAFIKKALRTGKGLPSYSKLDSLVAISNANRHLRKKMKAEIYDQAKLVMSEIKRSKSEVKKVKPIAKVVVTENEESWFDNVLAWTGKFILVLLCIVIVIGVLFLLARKKYGRDITVEKTADSKSAFKKPTQKVEPTKGYGVFADIETQPLFAEPTDKPELVPFFTASVPIPPTLDELRMMETSLSAMVLTGERDVIKRDSRGRSKKIVKKPIGRRARKQMEKQLEDVRAQIKVFEAARQKNIDAGFENTKNVHQDNKEKAVKGKKLYGQKEKVEKFLDVKEKESYQNRERKVV